MRAVYVELSVPRVLLVKALKKRWPGVSFSRFAPGRFADRKLLREQTCDSIMLFEESLPPGTKSTFHLHHHSLHLF